MAVQRERHGALSEHASGADQSRLTCSDGPTCTLYTALIDFQHFPPTANLRLMLIRNSPV